MGLYLPGPCLVCINVMWHDTCCAGMSTPRNAEDLRKLAAPDIGIKHVLTLTKETPLDPAWFSQTPLLGHTHMPVTNYEPPSPGQIDEFMRLAVSPDSTPLLVHCGGGKGRAGTLLACYLVAYGFRVPEDEWSHPAMPSARAIAMLRAVRPGSLETPQQVRFQKLLYVHACV